MRLSMQLRSASQARASQGGQGVPKRRPGRQGRARAAAWAANAARACQGRGQGRQGVPRRLLPCFASPPPSLGLLRTVVRPFFHARLGCSAFAPTGERHLLRTRSAVRSKGTSTDSSVPKVLARAPCVPQALARTNHVRLLCVPKVLAQTLAFQRY